ncbi:MAG: N-acetylneuraminate synthase family protein [Ferrovibrio sp.]|uniref:N-acetylneuraminate synthase family protein n=1 Tax=Ferrovibrio sp. TaxID=1917215 RepID=UPI00261E86BC|nr:N-acetylneuraminate synthase family protein [Ferrovibrio sp.]MCW0234943.1 N-acetylneuraminate synthase family protein [Ferrovibrio sp.]
MTVFHNSVIAEIGSVHDGSFGNACKLIALAAELGADWAKFQTHIAEAETLANAPSPAYFRGEPRMEYFRRTGFSLEQWRGLKTKATEAKINFLSSPFSLEAVDLLEAVGVDAYKIPSGEVTNLPLLERVAATRKPTLLSSGMSDWAELDRAVAALRPGGPLIIMQCTSAYPCPPDSWGLNVIGEMSQRYRLPVGFSDHSVGLAAPIAAAALGAVCIEKHLTFSKKMYGSDAANAMEPEGFAAMVDGLHETWTAFGSPVNKDDMSAFADMKRIFEKSIVSARALDAGAILKFEDLAFKKPGDGISATRFKEVIGKQVRQQLPADHKFTEKDFK